MSKRYFIYKDNNSDKFWSIEVIANSTHVTYGKTGTAGSTTTKEFKDASAAQKDAEKLIKEKTKKGYLEITELVTPPTDGRFGDNEFWALIERAKQNAESLDDAIEQLTEALSQRSKEDIIQFARIFYKYYRYAYQSRLWAAAYIINGGCSDDGFDYFRAWLIAQGKIIYFATVHNPEYLAGIIPLEEAGEIDCEDMLAVAGNAYAIKTKESSEKIYDFIPTELMHMPEIELDWDDDGESECSSMERNLEDMFPLLWDKFGNNI